MPSAARFPRRGDGRPKIAFTFVTCRPPRPFP
jgi:hypothetical protein